MLISYNTTTLACKYDGTEWTEFGSLLNGREGYRSIVLDNTIMHIGGYGPSTGQAFGTQ